MRLVPFRPSWVQLYVDFLLLLVCLYLSFVEYYTCFRLCQVIYLVNSELVNLFVDSVSRYTDQSKSIK